MSSGKRVVGRTGAHDTKRHRGGTGPHRVGKSGRGVHGIKKSSTGAITKFSYHGGPAKQLKTVDKVFSGSYAAGGYTPDTAPLQQMPINDTGALQAVNLITANQGVASRLTNKIAMKSFRCRFLVRWNGANSGEVPQAVRLMLIYHRNCNGTYPAVSTVLQDVQDTNQIVNGDYTSSLSVTHFEEMVVLKDEFRSLPSYAGGFSASGGTDGSQYMFDWYVKLKDLETIFASSASPPVIANIQTGALYLLCLGNQVHNTANDTWEIYGTTRLRFKDV